MELKSHIKLSKKHQKKLSVFPYFFIPALNEFYFLRDDFGFRKPELDTWKNEANLIFISKTLRVIIEYEYPNWIDVKFRKHDIRGYIYWRILLEELNFPLDEGLLTIQEQNNLNIIEVQIAARFKDIGTILKDNWGRFLVTTQAK
ncbi:MAG: hypothetical protein L0287_01075 [Anaerolineae bacterium]|nr:hypothetical protein [Anaerolineae bacterium]MCI0607621.1 hypothetical protein [Anaerolineae bacterium]